MRVTCAEIKEEDKTTFKEVCFGIKETHFFNMGCVLAIARVSLVVVNTLFTVREYLILLEKTLKQKLYYFFIIKFLTIIRHHFNACTKPTDTFEQII